MGWYYDFASVFFKIYGHETIRGYEKKHFMGEIKIMAAKEIRDAIDSLDKGKFLCQKMST